MTARTMRSLLLVPAVLACGDFSLDPDHTPARLEIAPDTVVVMAGETKRLSLRVLDATGQAFEKLPTWSEPLWSASPSGLLSFVGDEVEGLSPGAARALVSVAGLTGSATILVNPNELRVEIAAAYLTQATQRIDRSVPLVAGRDALLRVFLRGDVPNFFQPAVRATLYDASGFAHSFRLERDRLGLPLEVERGALLSSWNVTVPGALLEPGTQLVLEADPDGLIPHAPGSTVRVPAEGRMNLNVVRVPPLYLRYVRVYLTQHGSIGTLEPSDPVSFSWMIYEQFPIGRMDVDVRNSIWISDARLDTENGWSQLLYEILFLQYADHSDRYYYGVVELPAGTPYAGLGFIGWPVAIGADDLPETAAHELGHNFGLPHAPCGGPSSPDPQFPYATGSIGTFGYSLSRGDLFDPATTKDLMSYCRPRWISDYNYVRAGAFRDLYGWGMTGADRESAGSEDVLVLWGGFRDGQPTLEPAFQLRGAPVLPESDGPYSVEGYDRTGTRLFALSFDGQPVDHAVNERHFLFAVPLSPDHFDRLHRIRLSGPDGTAERVTRDRTVPLPVAALERTASGDRIAWPAADYRAALIRDAVTGELIGINRDGRLELAGSASGIELLLSDGVRTVRAEVQ